MGDIDLEKVRAFMVLKGMRDPKDMREILPPEIRFFEAWYPMHEKQEREKVERAAEQERYDAQRRESQKRAAELAFRMKDMRKWGPENGFFVGTRGRIPRKVVEAYNKAKGIQE